MESYFQKEWNSVTCHIEERTGEHNAKQGEVVTKRQTLHVLTYMEAYMLTLVVTGGCKTEEERLRSSKKFQGKAHGRSEPDAGQILSDTQRESGARHGENEWGEESEGSSDG